MIFAYFWSYFAGRPLWFQCAALAFEAMAYAYVAQLGFYMALRRPAPPLRSRLWSLILLSAFILDVGSQFAAVIHFADRPLWLQCIGFILKVVGYVYCTQLGFYLALRKPVPPLRSRLWSLTLLSAFFAAIYVVPASRVASYHLARMREAVSREPASRNEAPGNHLGDLAPAHPSQLRPGWLGRVRKLDLHITAVEATLFAFFLFFLTGPLRRRKWAGIKRVPPSRKDTTDESKGTKE